MLHSLAGAILLSQVLFFSTCSTGPQNERPTGGANPGAPLWSEAGRRAQARQAWHCSDQGTSPPSRYGTVRFGGRRSRKVVDTSCRYERFLCQQIHRGAQATDDEKAQCRNFESVHGRVSAR